MRRCTRCPAFAFFRPLRFSSVPAVRAATAIRIDSSLDEPDWARAPVARGFVQKDPLIWLARAGCERLDERGLGRFYFPPPAGVSRKARTRPSTTPVPTI